MIDITIIAQAKTFGTRRKLLARADKLTRGAKIKLFGRTDDTRLTQMTRARHKLNSRTNKDTIFCAQIEIAKELGLFRQPPATSCL